MRGKRWRALHAGNVCSGCCGDRSQGSSFSVQTFDQSAKKNASHAMGEICAYRSAAVPSSLYACMHACPSTLAIADDLPRLWTLASPVDVPAARLAFDLHADQVFLGVGSRVQVTSLISFLCDVCRLAVGASEKQQGRRLRVLVVLGHSHRDRAAWNRRSPACTDI